MIGGKYLSPKIYVFYPNSTNNLAFEFWCNMFNSATCNSSLADCVLTKFEGQMENEFRFK